MKSVLNGDTPDILILFIGCNDIGHKQLTENENSKWIVKVSRQCKGSNVSDVFISLLICRVQKRLNNKFITLNNILKHVHKLNLLESIDNGDIYTESGKVILLR